MPNKPLSKRTLTLAISLLMTTVLGALPSQANQNISGDVRQGLPGRRISGGVREGRSDSCFADLHQSLVAVMPRENVGMTTEAHPTFWFSVPETTGAKSVEFQLLTVDEELIYTTQIEMSNESGLSDFQLPEESPALEIGQDYEWALSVACSDDAQSSTALMVRGWVRPVELLPEMAEQLASATPEEQIALYAEAELWHEQVDTLMTLRRSHLSSAAESEVLASNWETLTESVGLTDYLSEHITAPMNAVEIASTEADDIYLY